MELADYYYYKIVVTHQAEKILMYDRTTVQGVTFNLRGQLYRGHTKGAALFSSPVVSALGFESGDPGSSPSRGRVLCLETCGKKNLMICKKIASMFSRYEVKSSHGEISISSVLHVCLPSGDYF